EVRAVWRAMYLMTAEAGHTLLVHLAVDEVIRLHAVLVRRTFREMREGCLTGLMLFQLPEVLQLETLMEADRPIVILTIDGAGERLALGVALQTGVVRPHEVKPCRVDDVRP